MLDRFRPVDPTVHPGQPGSRFVLLCEHASPQVPDALADLGLSPEARASHIAYDLGAAALTTAMAGLLQAPAVLAPVSRLVVDCNRDPSSADLIVARSDGIDIPANRDLTATQRQARIVAYHQPYHAAATLLVAQHTEATVVSIHSFTPELAGVRRAFDIGVLFDLYGGFAVRWMQAIATHGLDVRANEPYSGLDGLIYSARRHGLEQGRVYLEVEVNDVLLRDADSVARIAHGLAAGLRSLVER